MASFSFHHEHTNKSNPSDQKEDWGHTDTPKQESALEDLVRAIQRRVYMNELDIVPETSVTLPTRKSPIAQPILPNYYTLQIDARLACFREKEHWSLQQKAWAILKQFEHKEPQIKSAELIANSERLYRIYTTYCKASQRGRQLFVTLKHKPNDPEYRLYCLAEILHAPRKKNLGSENCQEMFIQGCSVVAQGFFNGLAIHTIYVTLRWYLNSLKTLAIHTLPDSLEVCQKHRIHPRVFKENILEKQRELDRIKLNEVLIQEFLTGVQKKVKETHRRDTSSAALSVSEKQIIEMLQDLAIHGDMKKNAYGKGIVSDQKKKLLEQKINQALVYSSELTKVTILHKYLQELLLKLQQFFPQNYKIYHVRGKIHLQAYLEAEAKQKLINGPMQSLVEEVRNELKIRNKKLMRPNLVTSAKIMFEGIKKIGTILKNEHSSILCDFCNICLTLEVYHTDLQIPRDIAKKLLRIANKYLSEYVYDGKQPPELEQLRRQYARIEIHQTSPITQEV